MKNIIIGTAGHIDHGKTSLIKAITGRDTDRLIEEKKRGITIDLGFTYFELSDGEKAGIIDVPGHEKFIKNMLAGVVGMDLVLLVVALDEGVMPQTVEHLNILNLLGVKNGIVVLTKYDMVDKEWIDLVKEDIKESLKKTFLENAPMIEVSSKTQYGIETLKQTIKEEIKNNIIFRNEKTIPRLPIDRVFTISGYGTVVTGTLISGTLCKGDEVEIYPVNKTTKIRNIQIYSTESDVVYAGSRTAINLSNIKKSEIYRGCVLSKVNSINPTKVIDVKLNLLESSRRIVKNRSRLHLYVGTNEVLCSIVLLDKDEISPGESAYAQLHLDEYIAVKKGDRFIVRFYSPLETIGGGEIIEANPSKKKRFNNDAIESLKQKEQGSSLDVLEKIIKENSKKIPTIQEISKLTARTEEEVISIIDSLKEEQKIVVFEINNSKRVYHVDYEEEVESGIIQYLSQYHKKNKYSQGIKKLDVKNKFLKDTQPKLYDLIIERLINKQSIKQKDDYLNLFSFEIIKDDEYKKAHDKIIEVLENSKYEFITIDNLFSMFNTDNTKHIIENMLKEKTLIKLNELDITTISIYNTAKKLLSDYLQTNGKVTAATYRDLINSSRKNTIKLLEHFDNIKFTKRVGDERTFP